MLAILMPSNSTGRRVLAAIAGVSMLPVAFACSASEQPSAGQSTTTALWPGMVVPQQGDGRLRVSVSGEDESTGPCWSLSLGDRELGRGCLGALRFVTELGWWSDFEDAAVAEAYGAHVTATLIYVGDDRLSVGYPTDVDLSRTYVETAAEVLLVYSVGSAVAAMEDFSLVSRSSGKAILWCERVAPLLECRQQPPE